MPLSTLQAQGGRQGGFYLISKVDLCGVDTARLPVLTHEQMRALLLRVQQGDAAAREQCILGNLRLVLSVLQRFDRRGEQADDLFQVGCIGLVKAIDNFDLSHEVRFSTYAVPMIIGEIRRHLRDYSPVRVSRSLRDLACKAMQKRAELMEKTGKEPTVGDIARAMGLKEEEVVFALEAVIEPVSLYEPVFHDDGDATYVIDQIRDNTAGEGKWLDSIALQEGMERLSERERKILRLRYYACKTQMEVSQEIGISQAQVSRIEKSALKQLEKYM